MARTLAIEVRGRDEFWGKAFQIEWRDQFPDRRLVSPEPGRYIVEEAWIKDLERVAAQCYCSLVRAPDSPERRNWMRLLLPAKPRGR
ncbi:MAG TPA: hypothetical protein VJX67_13845 [Blastocatellia bacterium]|nr:hypothetical protein [Blastocatellia bacterium]